MFNKIGAAILLVSDLKKSIYFYQNILGLELKQDSEDWVEFIKQGSTVLALHPLKRTRKANTRSILIGFNVSNIEQVSKELEDRKVTFYKKLRQEKFGKHAIIEDPDGHLISLVEMNIKKELTQIPYYYGFAPE